jgi:GDP-L-fucose synthase
VDKQSKIYVAGHSGMLGSSIVRQLEERGFENLVLRTSSELDLTNQAAVREFFAKEQPDYVFLTAAKVGGILANRDYSGDFIRDNLLIQTNVIDAAHKAGVEKLLFLGSSCIYPKHADQPISEDALLTGPLEVTNRAYAVAKIAGIEMCQALRRQYGDNFIAAMPTNLYGPGDNFDTETGHVLPSLIAKFHTAKEAGGPVTLWGSGSPKREFLHVGDCADAYIFLMENYDESEIINIGLGKDISIKELAGKIQQVVGFTGKIEWDTDKPDGTPRKLLDVSKIHALGWNHSTELKEGITKTYEWYRDQLST